MSERAILGDILLVDGDLELGEDVAVLLCSVSSNGGDSTGNGRLTLRAQGRWRLGSA